jgi:hypothetical protein
VHDIFLISRGSLGIWSGLGILSAIALCGIVRGFWIYRKSLTWPTADGTITRVDITRVRSTSGHHFQATFSYDFRLSNASLHHGTWRKDFASENDAREFEKRELPVGKRVIVRFNPKAPATNGLELDSWTYCGDRPLDLASK